MPQKDKDARKEYNRQAYLRRKQEQQKEVITNNSIITTIEVNIPDYYYLINFTRKIKIVNDYFLNNYNNLLSSLKTPNTSYKGNYDKVIQHLNNIDYEEECINYFNNKYYIEDGFTRRKDGNTDNDGSLGSNHFKCIFGEFGLCRNRTSPIDKMTLKDGLYKRRECYAICKSGIEILGMRPCRTKDGKYKYEGISVEDLRNVCKMNGFKCYSKLDKCELVKLLMTV
jgi:hypothetical protein